MNQILDYYTLCLQVFVQTHWTSLGKCIDDLIDGDDVMCQ